MRGSYNGDYKTDYNAEEKSAYGYYKRYFKSVGEEFPPVLIYKRLVKLENQLLQPFWTACDPRRGVCKPIGKCQYYHFFFLSYIEL